MAHCWLPTTAKSDLPRFTVRGCLTKKGQAIYVGRCWHEGDLLPAFVQPNNEWAFVSWCGNLYIKKEYEILVGPGYGWAPCQRGGVPRNAVTSGNCSRGEALYIGRGYYNGFLLMGKVHISHDCLYVPFGAGETRIHDYEVLVKSEDTWIPLDVESKLPDQAVIAGEESDGSPLYVARILNNEGKRIPANFSPSQKKTIGVDGSFTIYEQTEFELLCGPNYTWIKPHYNEVPSSAVYTDRLNDGQPMIVGRALYKGAIICGLESNESVILPLGKTVKSLKEYEVLIRHNP